MDSTVVAILTSLLVLIATVAGGMWAHNAGHLDPIIEKIRDYLVKAKVGEMLADGEKKAEEQTTKALGEENTEAAQNAVESVGDGLDLDAGEGELKKEL